MRDFMVTLLICSVTMSAVAVLYMAFTPLLAKRYSEKWRYYAWIVIVAGLIVPFRPHFGNAIVSVEIPGGASLPAVAEPETIITSDAVTASTRNPAGKIMLSDFTKAPTEIDTDSELVPTPAEEAVPPVASQSIVINWWLVISAVWLAGMIGFLAYHMIHYYRFNKTARRWSKAVTDRQTLELFHNLKAEMNIPKTIGIQVCPFIGSPMLIGLFRPRILLPRLDLSKDELYFILKHELVHCRRKDVLYKCLVLIAEAIHWFNPIVHLTAKAVDRGCELSCDAEVVIGTDAETRQHYSETIIGIAKYRSKTNIILSTNFYGGKKSMKNRITSIMDATKRRTGIVILCFALILTLCTSLVLAANSSPNKYTDDEETSLTDALNDSVNDSQEEEITANANVASGEYEQAFASKYIDTALYSPYESFGLTINQATGKLYYDGKLVRCFDDQIPTENFSSKAIGYYEENGVIDVRAIRKNENLTSVLVGLEVLSSDEFKNRIIADPTKSTTTKGTDIFFEYEKYGLTYDSSKDELFYNGEQVRLFLDIRNSNGQDVNSEEFLGSTISNWDKNGAIDVYTIRDYKDISEDGFGKLDGLRVATSEEYLRNSQSYYDNMDLTHNIERAGDNQAAGANISSYADGDVDVRAVRDSAGELIGVEPYSQADFNNDYVVESVPGDENDSPLEFWEINEFEDWMEQQRAENQKLADNGDKSFYAKDANDNYVCSEWTQEDVDALYAEWQKQLALMKQGHRFTKPIMLSDGGLISGVFDPATWNALPQTASGSTIITLPNGSEVDLGHFDTADEAIKAVKEYLKQQVANGTLKQQEADNILAQGSVE